MEKDGGEVVAAKRHGGGWRHNRRGSTRSSEAAQDMGRTGTRDPGRAGNLSKGGAAAVGRSGGRKEDSLLLLQALVLYYRFLRKRYIRRAIDSSYS